MSSLDQQLGRCRGIAPAVVAGVILLAGSVNLSRAQTSYRSYDQGYSEPEKYLRLEVVEVDPWIGWDYFGPDGEATFRALEVTYYHGRYGVGLSGIELWAGSGNDAPWSEGAFAPVHLRYDFKDDRRKNGFLYVSVPTCYAEIALGLPQTVHRDVTGLFVRLSAAAEVEYSGLGAGIEAGLMGTNPWKSTSFCGAPSQMVYLQLKLKLLTGSIRLGGD